MKSQTKNRVNLDLSVSHPEGTDPNNNSDVWYHTNCTEMMKDDDKTTKHLVKFLKSIGYEMPDVEIIEEKRK